MTEVQSARWNGNAEKKPERGKGEEGIDRASLRRVQQPRDTHVFTAGVPSSLGPNPLTRPSLHLSLLSSHAFMRMRYTSPGKHYFYALYMVTDNFCFSFY